MALVMLAQNGAQGTLLIHPVLFLFGGRRFSQNRFFGGAVVCLALGFGANFIRVELFSRFLGMVNVLRGIRVWEPSRFNPTFTAR